MSASGGKTYRCHVHDVIFETVDDDRVPGHVTKSKVEGSPDVVTFGDVCHPDCPKGKLDAQARADAKAAEDKKFSDAVGRAVAEHLAKQQVSA